MKACFVDLDDTLFDCDKLKAAWTAAIVENITDIKDLSEIGAFSSEKRKQADDLLQEEIKLIKPYSDLIDWIKRHQPAFLVTRGYDERQQTKIDALGIRDLFKEIIVTQDKKEAFAYLLDSHNLNPADVLVVGDKSHDEIKAGKEMGMRVQLVSGGEFL